MSNTFHIIIFLLATDECCWRPGSTELVLINFYADWCRFSNMLEPIWDEGADLVAKKLDSKRVLMAKVDCDKEDKLSSRFHITKYPTLKLIRNGHPAKKEYRGQRSAESFLKFLEEEIRDPVRFINSTDDLKEEKKGQVIGYFESPNSYSYQSFMKMASSLKDECVIIAGFGPEFRAFMPGGEDMVIVRKPSSLDDIAMPPDVPVTDTTRLTDWARRTCVPLVREITFENAEELTEEGLPFLILFHLPEDTETPKRFLRVVEKDLYSEKDGIQFLTADGLTFAHPSPSSWASRKRTCRLSPSTASGICMSSQTSRTWKDPVKMKQFHRRPTLWQTAPGVPLRAAAAGGGGAGPHTRPAEHAGAHLAPGVRV
ncbi:Endoplasmic reticulum resident protein 44 [Amphibalanus amphitrite]|uniref:Endoplasmic reticulum resident protein 44 n=1 Tax=Amphibalanus amphitrite TaxID=1232801 RepID=A0A6A4WNU0_AMPAM|nr:Endoplasmic reticulum resident protein 44 [Amphibalanus amphitrite]KAF0303788.1 Endoplasmic reticulum resident protein 44 [Amphibalanus amphitrite]